MKTIVLCIAMVILVVGVVFFVGQAQRPVYVSASPAVEVGR